MIPVPADVLASLAQALGMESSRLTYMAGGREDSDGVIYHLPGMEGAALLKIMALPAADGDSMARLTERLQFARFIGENGVQVVRPLPDASGAVFHQVVQEETRFVAYRMQRVHGRSLRDSSWGADVYTEWGRLLGNMHRLTQQYPVWRNAAVTDADGSQRDILSWELEWQGFYGWCRDDEVKERWVDMRGRLERLPLHRQNFGFIHNDPHAENLLFDGRQLTLLDFDVANCHWFMADLAIALQAVLFGRSGGMEAPLYNAEPVRDFLASFLEGYRAGAQVDYVFDAEQQELMDLFIAYRRMLLFTVMQDWLAQNEKTRTGWKQMILEEPPVVRGIFE